MKTILVFFLFLIIQFKVAGQVIIDSLLHQAHYRTFAVHVPSIVSSRSPAPLVIVLHGGHANALEMVNYSGFNSIADSCGFIAVYPNGYFNSWAIGRGTPADKEGIDDIDFFSNLIEYLSNHYNINTDQIYLAGYSDGGLMAELISIFLPNKIAAIASVASPISLNRKNKAFNDCPIPTMLIQGTADRFNETISDIAINYWTKRNNCSLEGFANTLPDITKNDNSTVVKKIYTSCSDKTEVVQYIINNGGHTWPGSFDIPVLGNTNKDINASQEIWKFFKNHDLKICITESPFNKLIKNQNPYLSVYPNPVQRSLFINYAEGAINKLEIFNNEGKRIAVYNDNQIEYPFNLSFMTPGYYMLKISLSNGETIKSMMVKD